MKIRLKTLMAAAFVAMLAIGCTKDATGGKPSGDDKKEEEKTVKSKSIVLAKTIVELEKGDTYQIQASVLPENTTNKNLMYHSSNSAAVDVDKNGKIIAGKEGGAIVEVSAKDGGCSTKCYVSVNKKGYKFTKRGVMDTCTFYCAKHFGDKNIKSTLIYYYIPSVGNIEDMKVQMVMHGTNRDADNYCGYWKNDADKYGLIILAPRFDKDQYPNAFYQQGGIFDETTGLFRKPEESTYDIIDNVFEYFISHSDSKEEKYNIWGHSAGGQFCHRFSIFTKSTHVDKIVAANPGAYTFPDATIDYPYGWKGCESQIGISRREYYGKNFTLMLGTNDKKTYPEDTNFPHSDADMAQGGTRYERGNNFYKAAQDDAKARKLDFKWNKVEVEGVGHDGNVMGRNAAKYLYAN